jgi:CBS domain-containing protein
MTGEVLVGTQRPGEASQSAAQGPRGVWDTCKKWTHNLFELRENQFFLFLAILIGIFSGLSVVCFRIAIDWTQILLLGPSSIPSVDRGLLVPTAGGLVVAFLVLYVFPRARGSGVNAEGAIVVSPNQPIAEVARQAEAKPGLPLLLLLRKGEWRLLDRTETMRLSKDTSANAASLEADAKGPLPILFRDQSLDEALQVLADWPVFPVVNRADLLRLEGVITVADILRAFRNASQNERKAAHTSKSFFYSNFQTTRLVLLYQIGPCELRLSLY